MRTSTLVLAMWVAVLGGCQCGSEVKTVKPSLGVSPASLDFGQLRNGDRQARTLTFEARTNTAVTIQSIVLEPGTSPGGVDGFVLPATKPTTVEAFSMVTMPVTFAPTAFLQYQATLVITSNDAEKPVVRIPLLGEGAKPAISVTPVCERAQQCEGTVTVAPPAIDFGQEPLTRAVMVPASQLPGVVITNDGPVPLSVTRVTIAGPDAAAFTFARTEALPWDLLPGEGRTPQLRFKPTSDAQQTYQAELRVESDDPDKPLVVVSLRGALRPNQAPQVCLNLVRVTPPPDGDGPREYGTAAFWATQLTPPAGGYDFTVTRDVRPGDLVQLSALSDAVDASRCTTDPEDGRAGLTYQWRVLAAPVGARVPALAAAATAQVSIRPIVTGTYTLELMVTDRLARSTTVTVRFACVIKQDLVAQLEWTGFDGVDLDLHLVRPSAATGSDPFSGVFSFFEFQPPDGGAPVKTSGDLNGYAARTIRPTITGANFDWGGPGEADDPRLNLDNTGMAGMGTGGDLLENISLNFPENDARCATSSCTYKVLVHAFRDARTAVSPPACVVQGACRDGERCGCTSSDDRCVAESAPIGDAGVGVGKCFAAPKAIVRLFVRGSTTAAKVIPLEGLVPADALVLGAPCQMLYVADVSWPAKSLNGSYPDGGSPPPTITARGADATGRVVNPVLSRFGYRQMGGSLQCSPDLTINGSQWYGQQP